MYRYFLLLCIMTSLHGADYRVEDLSLPSRNKAAKRFVLPEGLAADAALNPAVKAAIDKHPHLVDLLQKNDQLIEEINKLVNNSHECEEELHLFLKLPQPLDAEDRMLWNTLCTAIEMNDVAIIELKGALDKNRRTLEFEARKAGVYDVSRSYAQPRVDNDNKIRSIRRNTSPRRR